jgi:hypothetical protein
MNRMLPLAIVAALVLAVGAYLFYDRAQPACEGIYQQTALRIGGQVETIAAKGGLVMGREQIQALTEGAQKVGQHLRTCCAVLDAGRISGEQFQTCVAGAGQYEARLAQVASAVEQVSDARSAGQEAVAAQKTDQLEGLVDLATRGATDYTRQVAALTAESTSAAPTSATTPAEPNDTPAQASPRVTATTTASATPARSATRWRSASRTAAPDSRRSSRSTMPRSRSSWAPTTPPPGRTSRAAG